MALVGGASADHGEDDDEYDSDDHYEKGFQCGYSQPAAGKGFVFPKHHDICSPSHPESKQLKEACQYSLDHLYPDVTRLISHGFIPYFDIASVGGFSHWLHSRHINAPHEMDPGRPETVLINNNTYCAQGVMFIPNQESAGREPPVYTTGRPDDYDGSNEFIYPKRERRNDGVESQYSYGGSEYGNVSDGQDYYHDFEKNKFDVDAYEDSTICAPWHRHTDGAARFAWWYNRQFHEGAALNDDEVEFWCVVPAMFHVWPGAPEDDIAMYEHDSPSNNRTGETACTGEYETPQFLEDNEGDLSLEDLPESVQQRAMPDDLRYELEVLSDFDDVSLYQMTVGEIKSLVSYDV